MAEPSVRDGARFFPNVLRWEPFQRNGICFRTEPGGTYGYHWAVIDPRKHVLQVWQKPNPSSDFVAAGKQLGASAFSNAPYVKYRSKNVYYGGAAYLIRGFVREVLALPGLNSPVGPDMDFEAYNNWRQTSIQIWQEEARNWFGSVPTGHVIGTQRKVRLTPSNPKKYYFGRAQGDQFADYRVGEGDPPDGMTEVVGGLDISVLANQPSAPLGSNQHGHWGLAPLSVDDESLQEAGLEGALAAYGEFDTPDMPPLTGLIFAMYYSDQGQEALIASLRVRDAVHVDGSDSVLFGYGATALVGDSMSDYKRYGAMSWGYAFFPRG